MDQRSCVFLPLPRVSSTAGSWMGCLASHLLPRFYLYCCSVLQHILKAVSGRPLQNVNCTSLLKIFQWLPSALRITHTASAVAHGVLPAVALQSRSVPSCLLHSSHAGLLLLLDHSQISSSMGPSLELVPLPFLGSSYGGLVGWFHPSLHFFLWCFCLLTSVTQTSSLGCHFNLFSAFISLFSLCNYVFLGLFSYFCSVSLIRPDAL